MNGGRGGPRLREPDGGDGAVASGGYRWPERWRWRRQCEQQCGGDGELESGRRKRVKGGGWCGDPLNRGRERGCGQECEFAA